MMGLLTSGKCVVVKVVGTAAVEVLKQACDRISGLSGNHKGDLACAAPDDAAGTGLEIAEDDDTQDFPIENWNAELRASRTPALYLLNSPPNSPTLRIRE